jgi:hypothetical protein
MGRWMRRAAGMCLLLLLACAAGTARAEPDKPAGQTLSPEDTVKRYLEALKTGDFAAAYDYSSKAMTGNKSRDAWAKEQQWTMQMSDAKIFEYHVYPGKVNGDTAQVPDILSSQDKFLNQLGVPEYELYTLVREDGRWKIDRQQLLEKSEQGNWFPAQPQGKHEGSP